MSQVERERVGAEQACRGRILLLGDDGRMNVLLQNRLPEFEVTRQCSVTDGIAALGQSSFAAVLLNGELLEDKSASAAKALRQVGGETVLLLYGDAYTEVYGQEAVKSGADDYLIWPIPAPELRQWLSGNHRGVGENGPADRQGQKLQMLERYHELSQWAGQDKAVLIDRAQRIMAETLGVRWVKIREFGRESAAEGTETGNRALALNGPLGPVGEMVLGPAEPGVAELSSRLAQEAALFVGTLIHLAQRCEGLRHLATVDELTGAYNRRYLEFYLQQLIDESAAEKTELALLLFDIDNFKHYNDTYGHPAGDEILRQVTRLMHRSCRQQDVVARVGGDEFAVLFWDAGGRREKFADHHAAEKASEGAGGGLHFPTGGSQETAIFLSNRFRRILRTSEFPALGPEARAVLTISGGLASFPEDGRLPEQLWAKADEALLSAKRSGKNRIYLAGHPKTI